MKNHSLLNFLVFTCFLVVGYSVSTRFYQPEYGIFPSTLRLVTTSGQNSIATMNNGQRSILLISSTSIDTINPHLESIWLATYFPSDTTVRLLPIYPAGDTPVTDFEKQLNHSFGLNKKDATVQLDPDFIKLMEDKNYWWSGFFIFDKVALTQILNFLGGVELNGEKLSAEQALSEIPMVLDNPHQAFSSQLAILQSACHKLIRTNQVPDISHAISLLPGHIYTSLDIDQLQAELNNLYTSQHYLSCRFPTLEITRVER